VDNSPWKRLWICRKTDYVTNRCHCMKNWASAVTCGQCTDVVTWSFLKKCTYLCNSAFTSYCIVKSGTRSVSGQIERIITSNAVLEGRRNNEGDEGAECQMGTR
jgi:hypothetical protein